MNLKNKKEFNEYIVAFIDVLGAKELIENNEGFDVIYKQYKKTLENLDKKFDKSKTGAKVFSDNILFFVELDNNHSKTSVTDQLKTLYILRLVTEISCFQNSLLLHGILTRGGITIGEFYSDEVMVWGKALIRAYELESEIAIYPRIILDPNIILNPIVISEHKNVFYKDVDEIKFINIFPNLANINAVNDVQLIVEKMISKKNNETPITKKLYWLKDYLSREQNSLGGEPNERNER